MGAVVFWAVGDTGYPADPVEFVVTVQPGGRQWTTRAQSHLRLDGLTNGASYTISVRAQNPAGASPEVTSAQFIPWDRTPPAAVSGLTVAHRGSRVALSWTNPTDADFASVTVRRFLGVVRLGDGLTPPPGDAAEIYRGTGTTVSIDLPPEPVGYTFVVYSFDEQLNYADSGVTLYGTSLSSPGSVGRVTYGASVSVGGALSSLGGNSGERLTLYQRAVGTTTWSRACTATTSSTGHVTCLTTPRRTMEYEWRFAGSASARASTSGRRVIRVQTKVTARASASIVKRGGSFRISGSVAPDHMHKKVYLQRYASGTWRTLAVSNLSSTSTYAFRVTARRTYSYRVYKASDSDHLYGTSVVRRVSAS